MIDKKLMALLVCPVSKAPLELDKENNELICWTSGLVYPVRNGFPVLIEAKARELTEEEKQSRGRA